MVYEMVRSRLEYDGTLVNIRVDTVVQPDGSRADREAWYHSPEYRAIMHLRTDNTEGIGVIAEGK